MQLVCAHLGQRHGRRVGGALWRMLDSWSLPAAGPRVLDSHGPQKKKARLAGTGQARGRRLSVGALAKSVAGPTASQPSSLRSGPASTAISSGARRGTNFDFVVGSVTAAADCLSGCECLQGLLFFSAAHS